MEYIRYEPDKQPNPTSNMVPVAQNLPASPPMSPRHGGISQTSGFISDPLVDTTHESQNTSQNGEGRSPDPVHSDEGRVMILCFDGTGNKFGENSNVVRFFRALKKNDRTKQIVYYQPGIGTYNKRTFITHTVSTVVSTLDTAIALGLDHHVKQGYQFIVQNYRPGDKICVFGFSRGAHTARVVAGMVYKVGILPKENIEQVDFAFSIYSTTGYNGYRLSHEFKRTFTPISADQVSVDFVGVWDTVSSVGIIPKDHPYTNVNYAVKKFRHALSLDERRVRFRPNVWSEITLEREHELDVDIPVPDMIPHTGKLNRDNFVYKPPRRNFADVKEVWFAGTHADVGGGSHNATRPSSLSFIPLRWMIKECILNETGIIFDLEYLHDNLHFDIEGLLQEIDKTKKQNRIIQYDELNKYRDNRLKEGEEEEEGEEGEVKRTTHTEDGSKLRLLQRLHRHAQDIVDEIFDQLVMVWYFWWMLEVIPMLYTYQDSHGNWIRRRTRNFGRGRYVPVYKNKVLVHSSVEDRIRSSEKGGKQQDSDGMGAKSSGWFRDRFWNLVKYTPFNILLDRFQNRDKYTPRAYNWHNLQEQNVIEYVK